MKSDILVFIDLKNLLAAVNDPKIADQPGYNTSCKVESREALSRGDIPPSREIANMVKYVRGAGAIVDLAPSHMFYVMAIVKTQTVKMAADNEIVRQSVSTEILDSIISKTAAWDDFARVGEIAGKDWIEILPFTRNDDYGLSSIIGGVSAPVEVVVDGGRIAPNVEEARAPVIDDFEPRRLTIGSGFDDVAWVEIKVKRGDHEDSVHLSDPSVSMLTKKIAKPVDGDVTEEAALEVTLTSKEAVSVANILRARGEAR